MDNATIVVVDYCDRHPSARATYIAFKVEPNLILTLCDHCTHKMVPDLVLAGFELQLIPGGRTAPVG
jgi:hypothetical protein